MSQFYARYVPPASKPTPVHETPPNSIGKRHRSTEDDEPLPKKRKKQQRTDEDVLSGDTATQALERPTTEPARAPVSSPKPSKRIQQDGVTSQQHVQEPETTTGKSTKKKKDKRKQPRQEKPPDDPSEEVVDNTYSRKHDSVLSKFNKARAEKQPLDKGLNQEEVIVETQELHGLEPIPQPKVVDLPKQKLSYSTLAPWQSDAVRVIHRQSKYFKDLKISRSIADNLKKAGIEKSFPIQTTVLPLLLEGSHTHAGDVCVSAATGSGKTLAYVVPIIEDLKDYANTQLRAVIVVPTRELVQQVRQLCEICAGGTKLKIAAASGSKAMRDEQEMLVSEEEIYDPERWEQEQNAPMDWANFSMTTFLEEVQRQQQSSSIHYVKQAFSKVDVLITTPGRLVDHLRSTPGFNLDHVKWLVVDEADRLLNESYQEWIDTVMPALRSQAATSKRDELLKQMRMKPPIRKVQKVLLSATMTSDISKLSSLGLNNPKLVVLGHPQVEIEGRPHDNLGSAATEGDFHLPLSLTEYVVPIKDGYEKPLYLLELLQQRILPATDVQAKQMNGVPNEVDSPETTSDSDSDSDSNSDSDSESESNSDSDSSARTDSDSDSTSSISSSASSSSGSSPASKFRKPTVKKPSTQKPSNKTSATSTPTRALIFTRSTSAATRLTRLLTLLSPALTSQISTLTKSTSTSSASRRALSAFHSGKCTILIATDRASRGLDIPDLQHVVSYDVPSSALTYVHRVGRTARAGKGGTAWTILEHREGKWFWGEIGGKGSGKDGEGAIVRGDGVKVQKVSNLEVDVEAWKERYEAALGKLGDEVKGS